MAMFLKADDFISQELRPERNLIAGSVSGSPRRELQILGGGNRQRLQGVEVDEEIVNLRRGKRAAKGRHHPAALQDGLSNEPVVGRQAAGEISFLKQSLQAPAIQGRGGVCVVAASTGEPVDSPTGGLLGIQSELGVGFFRSILPATGQEGGEKDARSKGRDPSH
jgi:hypothetical protein